MIGVSFGGQPAWLCNHPHAGGAAAALRLRAPVTSRRGQTGREEREPEGDALFVARMEWNAIVDFSGLQAIRNAMQIAQAEPVLVPVWPLALTGAEWAAGPHVAGSYEIGWLADWSDYQISAGPIADPEAWDFVAPLLQGYFDGDPQPEALAGDVLAYKLAIAEDDAISSIPLWPDVAPATPAAPALGTYSPPAFPWPVNWAQPVRSGHASIRVDRVDIGGGRRKLTIAHPQSPERPVEGTVQLSSAADVARLLTWWRLRYGSAEAHWVSTWISGGRLAVDAAAGAESLQLAPGVALGGNRFVALHGVDSIEYIQISALDGLLAELAAPLVTAASAAHTWLALAILGRHASDELTLNFTDAHHATAALAWRELSAEYTEPPGEARGITLGRRSARAYFAEWTEDYVGAEVVQRSTNWRVPIVAGGHTWTPRELSLGERITPLNLAEHALSLKAGIDLWPDHPFRHFMPGQCAATVRLKLYRAEIVSGVAGALTLIWSGEVEDARQNGPQYDVTVGGPNQIFARMLPTTLFEDDCQADLFDSECALLEAVWRCTATVSAIVGHDVTLTACARDGGNPPGFAGAHWFALGVIQWSAGALIKRASIFDSTAVAAGVCTVTLHHVLDLAVGQTVALWPGCDKRAVTCRAYHATTNPEGKFDNFPNFQGFGDPSVDKGAIPSRSPQFAPAPKSNTQTGKK